MRRIKSNFEFGKADGVALSLYGPAFKAVDGSYISYDERTDDYIDVSELLISEKNMLCYAMPVSEEELNIGDYIKHNGTWARVVNFEEVENTLLIVADKIFEKERVKILATRNSFGLNYYTKLVNFAEDFFKDVNESNPFGNIIPLLLAQNNDNDNDNNLLPLLFSLNKNKDKDKKELLMLYLLTSNSNLNILPFL